MRAKLVNVGRKKFNGEVNFKKIRGLEQQIQKHLMSRNWDFSFEDGSNKADILVGGFRKVGEVKLENAVFCSHLKPEIMIIEERKIP